MKPLIVMLIVLFICAGAAAQENPERDNFEQKKPVPDQQKPAIPKGTSIINTPTAYTIDRASYTISIFAYDQGGIELKSFVGVHDNVYFGVSFDIQHALGSENPRPNVPGVTAKIKLVDGFTYFPAVAIGYDSFYDSKNGIIDNASSFRNKVMNGPYLVAVNPLWYLYRKNIRKNLYYGDYNKMFYGPYIVFTSPIYLFKNVQFINYGVRIPVQPEFLPKNTSYFFGLDIPLGNYFRIKAELERIFWNFRTPGEWVINTGVRATFFEQVSVEFDLMIEPGERLNRVLKIEYHGEF